jgi:Gas vesicle synthesis protein GvpL/GvpF
VSDAVYVYGVLAAADAASLTTTGVEGAPVRAVESGDLAALVSDVAGGALAAAREVRAHWRVLEAASRQTTVLPVRFGTVMEDDDAVRERLLAAGADRLTALLQELTGKVQLTVRGTYGGDALLRSVVSGSPRIAALRERVRDLPEAAGYYQRIELGELVAAEVQRRREADTALALERLAPLAAATKEESARGPDAAFHLAFLVERDRMDAFSSAVAQLGVDLGDAIAIRYVGPLAPYSFAEAELTAEAA